MAQKASSSPSKRLGGVEAPTFVPSTSNPPALTAASFTPALDATPFRPSGSESQPAAINAPAFVPSKIKAAAPAPVATRASVAAKPFVPDSSACRGDPSLAAAATSTATAVAAEPTQDTTTNPNDFQLPDDDDDVLGLSSRTNPAAAQDDMAAHAAHMFRSMRPFQQAAPPLSPIGPPQPSRTPPFGMHEPPRPSGGARGRWSASGFASSSSSASSAAATAGGGGGSAGRMGGPGPFHPAAHHRQPQHHTQYQYHQQQQQQQHIGPAPVRGGRGRGRGRRGGGSTGMAGPGSNRPFVSAYAVTPGRMQLAGKFMSETLYATMQQRNYLTTAEADEQTLKAAGLPHFVQQYHTPCPLEDSTVASEHPSSALGLCSFVFRCTHSGDGAAYALRRFDGRQAVPTADLLSAAEDTVTRWASVANHPNIVGLREAFVSDEIEGTPSLFLSYDYHPGAYTLEQSHVQPSHTPHGPARVPATEDELWAYLVQLTAALRVVHVAGLAVGAASLAPSKVLLTAPARVRLGAVGAAEALAEGPPADVSRAQREDLAALGSLILTLACAARDVSPNLDALAAYYSRELCHVVAGLLAAASGSGFSGWRALAAALGERVFGELESSQRGSDTLTAELEKECENGRLARLLIKLCMVNERPQVLGDTRWSETGDRYLLKLFRDFVFHRVDEDGNPSMDWGEVVEALNKADAGTEERVVLMSRDESSMLVVSYADIRRCLSAAYAELKGVAKGGGGGYVARQHGAGG